MARSVWMTCALRLAGGMFWVHVERFNLSYHNKETNLFTIDPYPTVMVT